MTPIYGVTFDDVSNPSAIVQMLESLPVRMTSRVVFDWNGAKPEPVKSYLQALRAIHTVSDVMGELLDSSYEKAAPIGTFQTMINSYLASLGDFVDIWEIGNEVNGNWDGPYPSVAAKLQVAYTAVANAGKKKALTLYLNDPGLMNKNKNPDFLTPGPDGNGEPTPVVFSTKYVPEVVREGLDYVLLSYYETQFKNVRPTVAWFTALFEELHTLYPNALLGFGEIGLPNKVSSAKMATAKSIMAYYYGLQIELPYYVGGNFWWYGTEDLIPTSKMLYSSFVAALESEKAALGG